MLYAGLEYRRPYQTVTPELRQQGTGVKEIEELFSLLSKTTLHVYTSRFYVNFSAVSNRRNFNLNWTNVQVL